MIPHKCPVCDGTGKISRPPWVPGDIDTWPAGSTGEVYDCRACNGQGIIWEGRPAITIVENPPCLHLDTYESTAGRVCRRCGIVVSPVTSGSLVLPA